LGETEASEIRGESEVREVVLSSGKRIPADLVLIAIGVRPRIGLAQDAGIGTNRGIVVNDFLETSAPDIYAAGDVAEWQGRLYGIIPAAREQGSIAAQNMVEPKSARYAGTNPVQRLKVAGVDLLCLGETQPTGGSFLGGKVPGRGPLPEARFGWGAQAPRGGGYRFPRAYGEARAPFPRGDSSPQSFPRPPLSRAVSLFQSGGLSKLVEELLEGEFFIPGEKWRRADSNRRPPACKAGALPTELRPLIPVYTG
jgi:NADPH-dependent 2,4-dienoyl-CoA reductase/sulfur reductase-like enzyme